MNIQMEAGINTKSINVNSIKTPIKIIMLLVVLIGLYIAFTQYLDHKHKKDHSLAVISEPKVNDIYFMDFRVIKEDLRPHEKYRIAKVVDVTGDVISLVYGGYYYQRKHAVINAIYYGHLSFKDYFEGKRYDIPHSQIKKRYENGAIYLANRPVGGKLYNNVIEPAKENYRSSKLTYGKQENIKGEAFFNDYLNEQRFEKAFSFFEQSAELGFAKGQVNLAEMYINGQFVDKDLNKAAFWLKRASLQSDKTAILKYGIVCKQVKSCDLADFYQELDASGVNIKVRKLDLELH